MRAAIAVMLLGSIAGTVAAAPVVWVASPWQHVLMSTPPGPERVAKLHAARNEYESFRVIVHSGDAALAGVNLTAGPLKGTGGTIPADNIELFREHYIDLFEPSARSTAEPGWYPDALIPFVDPANGGELEGARYDAVPVDVEAERNQGFWVDVYVPKGAAPGAYEGEIVVSGSGGELARVPVQLQVWDFSLPETVAMRSNFGALGSRVAAGHGMDAGSEEFRVVEDRYIDTFLAHRCMPSSLGSVWPAWSEEGGMDDAATGERLRQMVEDRHVNALRLPFSYQSEPEKCKAFLGDLADYLREKGWLDLAYIYMRDEPNDAEEYETVREQGALIKSADADISRMCTEQTITSNAEWGDLYGAVDIWCPLWGLWDEETAKQRQALGERMWSYTALCQRSDRNPYWQIDFPPVSFRAPFWVSWHYDIEGFLYWSSVYWPPDHDPWTNPHFRDRYWGEGMLVYPGVDAGIDGPVPSIRLKLVREALEDFEYMTLAAAEAGAPAVDEIVDEIATSFTEWDRDPAAYMKARAQLAGLITAR